MSYLLDKKAKRKRFFKIALITLVLVGLFYFRISIWNGFSYVAHLIVRPVFVLGNSVGGKLTNTISYFSSKASLYEENKNLQSKLDAKEARMANYESLFAENEKLKEILGRKDEKFPMILSAILAKPNQSAYDTLIIDVGTAQGIKTGDKVFALGDVLIGRIAEVFPNSSKVILYTNPGEKTEVVVYNQPNEETLGSNVFVEMEGRGGGNFEIVLPAELNFKKGDQVTMPGLTPYILAIVETVISDPHDLFNKALLRSPVNIQEIKFVEVESK